jgi:hypothetical protein
MRPGCRQRVRRPLLYDPGWGRDAATMLPINRKAKTMLFRYASQHPLLCRLFLWLLRKHFSDGGAFKLADAVF